MANRERIISDFTSLGQAFARVSGKHLLHETISDADLLLVDTIENSPLFNPWFIPPFVRFSFSAWAEALQPDKIERWLDAYPVRLWSKRTVKTVGIIMAGNIPMVGLHDLLCVIASGNHALIRLSSDDDLIIPAILQVLCAINPGYKDQFTISREPFKNFQAVIATGSNNSSRYFDYYFGKYPCIIRKNRNSAAVITGEEPEDDLRALADDIFMYFGMGCRNVSKIFIPEGYDVGSIFPYFSHYAFLADMHKYRNNYEYQKSILLINRIFHHDNGFILVMEDPSLISPISVLHYESYKPEQNPDSLLNGIREQLQCTVTCSRKIRDRVSFGRSQFPQLWDYADGVDTMKFLMDF